MASNSMAFFQSVFFSKFFPGRKYLFQSRRQTYDAKSRDILKKQEVSTSDNSGTLHAK